MINEQNDSKWIWIIGAASTMILAILVIFALINYFTTSNDVFATEVLTIYMNNLYGTGRFSAVPFFDVPIMVLLFIHLLLFLVSKKKDKRDILLFVLITSISVIFIMTTGRLYISSWAVQNMQEHGEYLTGFGQYMLFPTILIYVYWIYKLLIKKIVDYWKKKV